MAYLKNLITGNINGNQVQPLEAIEAQRLASCMAWQILMDYPTRLESKKWGIYNNLRGVMLADEVGGGKTFETLAIISKALLEKKKKQGDKRSFYRKVLIIANPSIRSKWKWNEKEEMTFNEFNNDLYEPKCDLGIFIKQSALKIQEKIILFNFFSNQTVIGSRKTWLDFNKNTEGIWLVSFPAIPNTKNSKADSVFVQDGRKKAVFPNNFFDWIIVDEAHSLKSGSKDVDEAIKLDGSAIRKIYAVINASPNAKVILLTATPFQNNKSELKHLLSLLEETHTKGNLANITEIISKGIDTLEKEFSNFNADNISIEKVKNLKQCFYNDINKLIGNTDEEYQRPTMQNVLGKKAPCKQGLDDFLRDVMIRNTKKSLPIIPVVATLSEKEKLQYLLLRDLVKTTKDKSQMFSTRLSQLVSSRDSFSKGINLIQNAAIEKLFGGNLVFEAKYKKLLETIEAIKTTKAKNVITVFVSWLDTVKTLEKRLGDKYKVFPLTSETARNERGKKLTDIKDANSESNEKIILLASRVGNEGLDFDKFSNRVIHYDNNFNPAIIDQRNGRVYRGSNIKTSRKKVIADDIIIYQLFLEESYDQRILFIEQEKRKMKNFYLGDSSLDEVLKKIIKKNNLPEEKTILDIMASIKIDLTPSKKYILSKYKNEL